MVKKDLSQKYLVDHNDVFADIINVLLGNGAELVCPDDLENLPTETIHYNEDIDELENMFRDICKRDGKDGQIYAIFGIEFQGWIDYSIPLRLMGYDYTAYENQAKRILEKRRQEPHTDRVRLRKKDKLAPVVTLVLDFNPSWKAPTSLHDMLRIPESLKKASILVPDYKINLISLKNLDLETLKSFQSDFKIIAAYVRFQDEPEKLEAFFEDNYREIKHPLEVRKAFTAISRDNRYQELDFEKEEEMGRCKFFDMMENRGIQKGIQQGVQQGEDKLNNLYRKLKADDRISDIMKAIDNIEYQKLLLDEYCL